MRQRHQQQSRHAEMDQRIDQETILGKRWKGDHAVPDLNEKNQPRLVTASLVEPLQSGSQAHAQYTRSHVTLYTVFLRWYLRLDTLVIMYS